MKLKVLGSGSSGNCYLIQGDNETLIIECGIKYKEILQGLDFNISNIVGCLCSHSHRDHSKAIQEVLNAGIDVYSSKETFEGLNINSYRAKAIEPLKQFKIGDFTILPFPLEHDVVNFGYLIQHGADKIVFLTDTYFCQYKFKNLNHIMIEANYEKSILDKNFEEGLIDVSRRKRLVKSHFSLDNVKEFLKANDLSKVKDITLIHLSAGNSDPELFKSEIQRLTGKPVYVASKGLEIEL